jgi:hypothetical protein
LRGTAGEASRTSTGAGPCTPIRGGALPHRRRRRTRCTGSQIGSSRRDLGRDRSSPRRGPGKACAPMERCFPHSGVLARRDHGAGRAKQIFPYGRRKLRSRLITDAWMSAPPGAIRCGVPRTPVRCTRCRRTAMRPSRSPRFPKQSASGRSRSRRGRRRSPLYAKLKLRHRRRVALASRIAGIHVERRRRVRADPLQRQIRAARREPRPSAPRRAFGPLTLAPFWPA